MKRTIPLLLLALFLAGCETRSISDSGYRHPYGWGGGPGSPLYRGELTELDILGAAPGWEATKQNIARALEVAGTPIHPSRRQGDLHQVGRTGARQCHARVGAGPAGRQSALVGARCRPVRA